MQRKEFFFDTGEISLHIVEGPDSGPPLVLLHGASGRWQGWLPILPQLEQHWHVYAVDLRGHGQSTHAADVAGYHLGLFARDIAAFLRERVESPCLLMGHSWGALTALFAAQEAPERVRALVLEDPPLMVRRENTENKPFLDYFNWAYQQKQAAQTCEALMAAIRLANPQAPESAIAPWADTLYALDGNFLLAVTEPFPAASRGLDFGLAIEAVNCPALLLRGDPARGGAIPDFDMEFFRQHARSFEVIEFETGHGIHDEQPAEVLEALKSLEW